MSDDDRWLDVAASILDGTAVAWDAVPNDRTTGDPVTGDELRLIADIVSVHRTIPDLPPTRWGPLETLERIGHGTFGDVYRARDTALDRDVALKLLEHGFAGAADEGRLLARVRHPNVVTVYGAAVHEEWYGIWMEFVRGRTLAAIVRDTGPLDANDVIAVGGDICRALSAVHAAGLLHGDIKAQNVMREDGGRTVLMDFGTGRFADDAVWTRLAGTPLYLAPEVLNGARSEVRADIYSVGVLLYYLRRGLPGRGTEPRRNP